MIAHDCTRQEQLVSFIECQRPAAKSGWFLDNYYRDLRSTDEKLVVRRYSKADALPLFYTGACLPPALITAPTEVASKDTFNWPTIKAKAQITGCNIDERRIDGRTGDITPVGIERFNKEFNYQMMALMDGVRNRQIGEAITLLKTGGYVLHSSATENFGAVSFGRNAELANINLVGTSEDFCNPCSRPFGVFEDIGIEMGRCGGNTGQLDFIYGKAAWNAVTAHEERDAIKYSQRPGSSFDRSLGGTNVPSFGYNDIIFKGSTNGGSYNHYLSTAKYIDHTGALVDVVAPGEVLIVSKGAFDGQRIFRTWSSDNREFIPEGGLPMFIYDGIEQYKPECRTFEPWIELHHLLVPANVNGAALVRVTADTCEPCVACEECP